MLTTLCKDVLTSVICVCVFLVVWTYFWRSNKGGYYYFDAQDFAKYANGGGRKLPVSASTGTFAPMIQHYVTVTQLMITVAAASIAFGGHQGEKVDASTAKLILAFSILYGLLFCAALLYRYDEYMHDVESYTRFWYSTVESLGFSTLICFILGYLVWAFTA